MKDKYRVHLSLLKGATHHPLNTKMVVFVRNEFQSVQDTGKKTSRSRGLSRSSI